MRLVPPRGMKGVRECLARAELDLHTLVRTRGAGFPISQLDRRLKCPVRLASGSANFDAPKVPVAKRIAGMLSA
jgi:hypothetical protein